MLKKVLIYNKRLLSEVIVDMVDAGIVDSFNVIRTILQDSVSIAGMLLTTECLVVKEKSYERKFHIQLIAL